MLSSRRRICPYKKPLDISLWLLYETDDYWRPTMTDFSALQGKTLIAVNVVRVSSGAEDDEIVFVVSDTESYRM